MTRQNLKNTAVFLGEYDHYDGFIYLYTEEYYYKNDCLYVSEIHSNANRYTGKSETYLVEDRVRESLNKYNELYWSERIPTEEMMNKLIEIVGTEGKLN